MSYVTCVGIFKDSKTVLFGLQDSNSNFLLKLLKISRRIDIIGQTHFMEKDHGSFHKCLISKVGDICERI